MARKGASARKAKAKRRGAKRAGKKMMTFDQRVTAVLSRNIEDKYTDTKTALLPVCSIVGAAPPVGNLYTWARFAPSASGDPNGIWNIQQGVGNESRVGNKIKVKKWLIKGLIQPVDNADPAFTIAESYVGYVTVYLGRLNTTQPGGNVVPGDLHNLLQEGNQALAPTGSAWEMMYATNTDRYKVYAKKTFKVGQSFSVAANPGKWENNDFNLTSKFTFDVTKYVFKNRHIMYDDNAPEPQNFDMGSLCVWCTFQPAVGIFTVNLGAQTSFYQVQFLSYGQYEDA